MQARLLTSTVMAPHAGHFAKPRDPAVLLDENKGFTLLFRSQARAECRVEPACGAVYTWLAYRYPVPAGESQFGVEEEMTYEVKLHSCTRVLLGRTSASLRGVATRDSRPLACVAVSEA